MVMNFIDAAAGLVSVGFKIIPIAPGMKVPLIEEWQKQASDDADIIGAWASMWPDANIAIATGKASGVLVIDLDVKEGKDGHATIAALAKQGKRLPPSPAALTPSGGRHLFFRMVPGIRNCVEKQGGRGLGSGVDVRAEGGYVVAPPSRLVEYKAHGAGTYRWLFPPMSPEFPKLPDWAVKMLTEPPVLRLVHSAKPFQPRDCDEARIRSALFAIPPDDRTIWCNVGMALKDHLGEAGRKLWDEWSQKCADKYDPRDQEKNWRSFTRKGITINTVFHCAFENDWRNSADKEASDGHA
jgi:hypothetical protein